MRRAALAAIAFGGVAATIAVVMSLSSDPGSTAAVAAAAPAPPPQAHAAEDLPPYSKTSGVSGSLNSIGSDTLNNLMAYWTEAFQKQYPGVKIQVEAKGSGTAPPALIAGTAQLGPMSRLMKPTESDEFEKKFGYKPTPFRVAIDALAVYVNKDNPLEQITLAQADAVFSKARKRGLGKDVTTWGDLGLAGEWANRPLSLFGRNSASGTYGFFKEHVLQNGDYKDTVKEQPGSSAVVQGVTEDKNGIGYSGIGYRTPGVKPLKLADKEGSPYFDTGAETVYAGKYPLARFLYVYVNVAPNKPLDPLVREFLTFVLSREGQQEVVKDGFLPLMPKTVGEERAKISGAKMEKTGKAPTNGDSAAGR